MKPVDRRTRKMFAIIYKDLSSFPSVLGVKKVRMTSIRIIGISNTPPCTIHSILSAITPENRKDIASIDSAEKKITGNISLHFHFLIITTPIVAKRRKLTNITKMLIPPSKIFKNLQGRSLKRNTSSPYFSYGNQYHINPENDFQLEIMYAIRADIKLKKPERKNISKVEDLSFLLSTLPRQKIIKPARNIKIKTKDGFICERKFITFSMYVLITVYIIPHVYLFCFFFFEECFFLFFFAFIGSEASFSVSFFLNAPTIPDTII